MTKRKDPSELKKRGRPAKEKPEEKEPASAVVVSTPESPDTSEVAIVEQPQEAPVTELVPQDGGREAALSIVGGVTTPQLEQALKVQTEQRKLIQQFIQDNLAVDVDYGRIHVVKNCQAETNQRGSCDRDYHFSKSILFKPGQEKIFSLFGITDELVKDEDAYEMLPGVKDLVAYKCIMWRGKNRVGEGRGAATLSGTQNDPNATIKKAEKRARMDACLSLGFSAYFTQDLDDPEYKSQREMMNEKARNEAERRDKDDLGLWIRDPNLAIDNEERQLLFGWIKKIGYEEPDVMLELLAANDVANPKSLKSGQARDLIRKFKSGDYVPIAVTVKEPDTVIEDIGDDPVTLDDIPETPAAEPEPELVIDEDLKNYVTSTITNLGLTGRGMMWLYQRICGRPFAKFDKMNDAEWRKAYDIILALQDGNYDIPAEYFTEQPKKDIPDNVDPKTGEILDDQPSPADTVQELFPGATVEGGGPDNG